MNRYLITALYVMAGCAVTFPLKAQGNGELLRGEKCRLVITHTVRTVVVCLEEEWEGHYTDSRTAEDCFFSSDCCCSHRYYYDRAVWINAGSLCRTSHKIRAPEVEFEEGEMIFISL